MYRVYYDYDENWNDSNGMECSIPARLFDECDDCELDDLLDSLRSDPNCSNIQPIYFDPNEYDYPY